MIGLLILGLSALLVAGSVVLHARRASRVPELFDTVGGLAVRWLPGSVRPWPGLERTCAAIAASTSQASRLLVEVVPYEGLCISPSVPGGFLGDKRATGTCREEGPLVVMVVRQLRAGDTSEMNARASGLGPMVDANRSALVHEFARHAGSYLAGGGWDPLHQDETGKSLERYLSVQLRRIA